MSTGCQQDRKGSSVVAKEKAADQSCIEATSTSVFAFGTRDIDAKRWERIQKCLQLREIRQKKRKRCKRLVVQKGPPGKLAAIGELSTGRRRR